MLKNVHLSKFRMVSLEHVTAEVIRPKREEVSKKGWKLEETAKWAGGYLQYLPVRYDKAFCICLLGHFRKKESTQFIMRLCLVRRGGKQWINNLDLIPITFSAAHFCWLPNTSSGTMSNRMAAATLRYAFLIN